MKKSLCFLTATFAILSNVWAEDYTNKIFIGFKGSKTSKIEQEAILKNLATHFPIIIEPSFTFSTDQLKKLSENAIKNSGSDSSIQHLSNLYTITVKDENYIDQLLPNLQENIHLEYAEREVYMPKPPADIPPTTPFYNRLQGYIRADSGINVTYAWSKGIFGQNVNVYDIEYGVNIAHEKLEDKNLSIMANMIVHNSISVDFSEHGTASIGVLYADKLEYGNIGTMHGIEKMTLVPEYTEARGYNRLYAVQQAIADAKVGDVIMYEMQMGVDNTNDYVPADYSSPIWNATKAAVDAGIIIVAAAGNGNVDLDYDIRLDAYRNKGDNGSIIVGAGSADMRHNILSFSTFGSRVNVQGWGERVISPGYGSYSKIGNDFNQGYTLFNGTSSATPVVTSAVVAVQSYYHSKTNEYLNCRTIRDILIKTGTPQGDSARGNIGPLPNIKKAFDVVDSIASSVANKDISTLNVHFNIFPNPATSILKIDAQKIKNIKQVYIFDVVGNMLYAKDELEKEIDISQFAPGNYQLMILDKSYQIARKSFTKL